MQPFSPRAPARAQLRAHTPKGGNLEPRTGGGDTEKATLKSLPRATQTLNLTKQPQLDLANPFKPGVEC